MNDLDTLTDILAVGTGADPAVITTKGTVVSHSGLRAEVTRLADRLRALGAEPGDRIAIVLPNGPAMAVAFLAAAVVGAAAPLNPRYRTEEFRFYLDDLGATILVTGPDDATGAAEARTAAGSMPVTVAALTGTVGTLELDTETPPPGPAGPATRRTPDDVALVLHTSGTTSRPKIVPISNRNLARSAVNIAESLALTTRDRSLNVMPLFHIHGLLAGLLAPLSAGGSVICTEGFDAFGFFSWLETLQPTYYTAVPTMHQMVLSRSARHQTTARDCGLRFVRSSSAPLPTRVLEELNKLFEIPVIEAYGMTEATHQICANPLPPAPTKTRSVGTPAGIELAILNDQNQPLPPNQRGEVSIKGTTVISNYENNPQANQAAFTAGWFRTGDEGYLDTDGYLYLTGRLKEIINRGGEKISPSEIDEALLNHEVITQAVTFATPHPKLGEDIAAAVVTTPNATITEQQLRHYLTKSLAAYKIPHQILFLKEIPKGPTGKPQRNKLAKQLGLTN